MPESDILREYNGQIRDADGNPVASVSITSYNPEFDGVLELVQAIRERCKARNLEVDKP